MKCANCGYEIDKPNRRTCPCCGQPVEIKQEVTEEQVETPDDSEEEALEEPQEPSSGPVEDEDAKSSLTQECPRCHSTISTDDNFCPKCGFNVNQDEDVTVVELNTVQPLQPKQEAVSETEYEPERPPKVETQQPSKIVPPPLPNTVQEPTHKKTTLPPLPIENHVHREMPPEPLTAQDESLDPYNGYDSAPVVDDGQGDYTSSSSSSSSFTWLAVLIACVVSILIGVLLYII